MKLVRYGLMACFCLAGAWGIAHRIALPDGVGVSIPDLPVVPAARQRASDNWRLLPILR